MHLPQMFAVRHVTVRQYQIVMQLVGTLNGTAVKVGEEGRWEACSFKPPQQAYSFLGFLS